MAEALVGCALNKVGDLLLSYGKEESYSRVLVTELKDGLESVQKQLLWADADADAGRDVKVLVDQIMRLTYEVEDVIDDLLFEMKRHRVFAPWRVRLPRVRLPLLSSSPLRNIEKITKKVKETDMDLKNLLLRSEASSGNDDADDRSYGSLSSAVSCSVERFGDGFVGMDSYVEQIMEKLSVPAGDKDRDGMSVIGIVGMSGVGKTTLARAVYNRVSYDEFDCRVWVNASATTDLGKHVLMDMLQQFYGGSRVLLGGGSDDSEVLAKTLAKIFRGKKFLLVLDDVWNKNGWNNIVTALPSTSRVILTTRRDSLLKMIPESRYVLKLEGLLRSDCWTLFCRKAFPHLPLPSAEDQMDAVDLRPIAKEIVAKCAGLPLSIVVIGALLSTKEPQPTEWRRVLDQLHSATRDDKYPVYAVVATAYADLPPLLKVCFLYFALFPKNYELSVKKIYRLWAAEGFTRSISPERTATAEEVNGTHWVHQLLHRNMIQISRVGTNGEVVSCSMLQPMWSFARSTSFALHFCAFFWKMGAIPMGLRRLSLTWPREHDATNFPVLGWEGIRTFVMLAHADDQQKFPAPLNVYKNMKLLRVLDLQNVSFDNLPENFSSFVHLRYLGLRGTGLKKLPASVGRLINLQTLDIRGTRVIVLPSMVNLLNLRHLLLASSYTDKVVPLPDEFEISSLVNLQTLTGVKITDKVAHGLGTLTQLQKLSGGQLREEASKILRASLNQLTSLRSLGLKCYRQERFNLEKLGNLATISKLRLGGLMEKFDRVASFDSLTYLYLWDSLLDQDPLQTLENLPKIVHLSLYNAFKGQTMRCSPGGFPKLKKLSVVRFRHLKKWGRIEGGAMRNLQELFIGHCPNLHKLPEGLADLDSLELVKVVDVPLEFEANQSFKVINIPQFLTLGT